MANMEFTIEKESLLTNLKIVEKTTVTRGIQPVLSNILIDAAQDNYITFAATDLDINIVSKTIASVQTPGKITLPAKKLSEIVSKLSNKPVVFKLNEVADPVLTVNLAVHPQMSVRTNFNFVMNDAVGNARAVDRAVLSDHGN